MKKWHDWLPAAEWTVGVILTIIAVILQIHWLGHAGALWRDEVGTVQFALMSGPSEIWTNLAYDNFPPVLLGPLRVWIADIRSIRRCIALVRIHHRPSVTYYVLDSGKAVQSASAITCSGIGWAQSACHLHNQFYSTVWVGNLFDLPADRLLLVD